MASIEKDQRTFLGLLATIVTIAATLAGGGWIVAANVFVTHRYYVDDQAETRDRMENHLSEIRRELAELKTLIIQSGDKP